MSQVALVTGAAQGLGNIIARRLHAAGYKLVLTDVSEDMARAAAGQLDASGDTVLPLALDVMQKAAFEAALAAVQQRWGGLHVVVNNAAITPTTPVMQITPEEFDKVLAINLRGTFLGCQVFGAAMGQAGYGRLINVASLAGQNGGTASGAHYAASKGGILTLTKIFARELAASGVTVNAIAPGPMELPSVRAAVPPERLEKLIEMIPVKRLGNPEFVASLVVQLASVEADFATGAAWDVNGGIFMR
ncbi:SDR family NAD(P)-dependent oxidoreductase [Zoogloea dura]|jgi:3-oxoacyl-[acyl-carrier protein] reductase|uniref:SDR family oxidoreductase n=1 Tax=Zoogloea dura TaxID=2728840 RepID=A0A848GC62_9RHOO|nr:SDR family NAD(P)-dependent oxidoreductase [Zoogloea dura]NML28336.1 SDR family oxidoreductase [Zoogloea dura]